MLAAALDPTLELTRVVTGAADVRVTLLVDDVEVVVAVTRGSREAPTGGPGVTVVRRDQPLVATQRELPELGSDPRSWVGVPVLGWDGRPVGCLSGTVRGDGELSSGQLGRWQSLAAVVADQLELLALRQDGARVSHPPPDPVTPREVAEGLRAGQFEPWFQPVVDLASGEVCSYEALARWRHPVRGLLAPAWFVAVAERSDLVVELDVEMWRLALLALAEARRVRPDLGISLNFSPRHTQVARCPDRLSRLCAAAGVPSSAVEVEITETAHLAADADGTGMIRDLRDRGFRVALDDFGAGWASVTAMLELPHDVLKVDRALISHVGTRTGRTTLRAVVDAASAAGVTVTAEGVETADVADQVTALGFTHGQGYYWGRPQPDLQVHEPQPA